MRRLLLLSMVVSGCTCSSKSNGPLNETAPADLATKGIVIDQPSAGAQVTGSWVTVSGWLDPAVVADVAIVGAPVDGFYLPTGHVGMPTVPVTFRADGRFFASRVPVLDGPNTFTLIPIAKEATQLAAQTLSVTATDTATVPATLVVSPTQPEPGKDAKLRAATDLSGSAIWQWDFDGDGTFDLEAGNPTHAWPASGRYAVTARTKINDRWVSAFAFVTVGSLPAVTASATGVDKVDRIFVISRFPTVDEYYALDGGHLTREMLDPRFVVTVRGDTVKVYDKALTFLFSLPGLSKPSSVRGDSNGRLWVTDTGHDRIVRFNPDGSIDSTFATGGAFSIPKPVALSFQGDVVEVLQETTGSANCNVRPGLLGDWSGAKCSFYEMSSNTSFKELGLTRIAHPIWRPMVMLGDEMGTDMLIVDGKVISNPLGSYWLDRNVSTAVDVALGPTAFRGDLAVVDAQGRISLYRSGQKAETWDLGFKATAVATDIEGHLFVGGPGHLEIRAIEALR